jgi:PBP1b-binding outer membrane lipoprotein LpoB
MMKFILSRYLRWTLAAVFLFFFTGSCSQNPEAAPVQDPSMKEANMPFDQKTAGLKSIPPIDAAAPAALETATFGLG